MKKNSYKGKIWTERLRYLIYTGLSASAFFGLFYLLRPGRLSGIPVIIVAVLCFLFIPLTIALLVSVFSKSPSTTFKVMLQWLGNFIFDLGV